jgi:hypothetical protein
MRARVFRPDISARGRPEVRLGLRPEIPAGRRICDGELQAPARPPSGRPAGSQGDGPLIRCDSEISAGDSGRRPAGRPGDGPLIRSDSAGLGDEEMPDGLGAGRPGRASAPE